MRVWGTTGRALAALTIGALAVSGVGLVVIADAAVADEYRLGRATDWSDPDAGPVRGVGQRAFLAGDELVSIMDFTELSFDAAAAP